MKNLFLITILFAGIAGLHSCSDDGFPVPPASTVPKFSRTIDNDELAPATVTFKNESIVPERAGTVTYTWNFGDGTSSSEENPVHLYEEPGAYDVTLVIVTSGSLEIVETTQSVVIKDPNATGVPFIFWGGKIKATILNSQPPIVGALPISGPTSYGMVIDTINSKLYITDDGQGKIFVSNLDGSDFKEFRSGIGSATGIAIDYQTMKLYYGTVEGTINTSDISNETLNQFETVVSGQPNEPTGIAIDPVTRKLFWNNYNGGVWVKNIDVAGGETMIIENPGGGGSIIVVGNRIYYDEYTATNDIKIKSTLFDGSSPATIITNISRLMFSAIAYDKHQGKLYWGDRNAATIKRSNLDGSDVENFYVSPDGYPRAFALGKNK